MFSVTPKYKVVLLTMVAFNNAAFVPPMRTAKDEVAISCNCKSGQFDISPDNLEISYPDERY